MKTLFYPALIVLLLCVPAAGAEENVAREIVLDGCEYKSEEAARKVWRSIQEDTPSIETASPNIPCRLEHFLDFAKNATSAWCVIT
ncbi:hypothetical protein ACFL01_03180 [Planctomycetota bacterium]